ncbi:unnamed protein product [Owenia fusiformis]|uniref:Protein SPT2 homolog n=1 Tax=Owenia fusiformis TaxID=6347 RepID=A0A8J1U1P5_OWEFU|nr:unnamed protein product [Owenia fusiformis]
MDFKKLLNFASVNSKHVEKKTQGHGYETTKFSAPKKDSKPKVNPEAVKAALAKQEQEAKKRALDEKKRRIQARVQSNLQNEATNKTNTKKTASSKEREADIERKVNFEKNRKLLSGDKAKDAERIRKEMLEKAERIRNEMKLSGGGGKVTSKELILDDDSDSDNEVKPIKDLEFLKKPKSDAEPEWKKNYEMNKHKREEDRSREKKHKHKSKHKNKDRDRDREKRHDKDRHHKSHDKKREPAWTNVPKFKKPVNNVDHGDGKLKKKKPFIGGAKPPLSFEQILAIAHQKHNDEDAVESAVKIPTKKKQERMMTQEEKDRIQRKKDKLKQNTDERPMTAMEKERLEEEKLAKGSYNSTIVKTPSKTNDQKTKSFNKDSNGLDKRKPNNIPNSTSKTSHKSSAISHSKQPTQNSVSQNGKLSSSSSHKLASNSKQHKMNKQKQYSEVRNNVLVCGGNNDSDSDSEEEDKPMNPWDRITQGMHKKAKKRSHEISDDEGSFYDSEYDEEMDDFIDDGDCNPSAVSSVIKQMFGYDKSKYRHEREDDLSDMEANFASIQREEARSAKLGRLEDLEDMKAEEEAIKRKMMMKKKKMKYR